MSRYISLILFVFLTVHCGRPSTWVTSLMMMENIKENVASRSLSSKIDLTTGQTYFYSYDLNLFYNIDMDDYKTFYSFSSADSTILEVTGKDSEEEYFYSPFFVRCLKEGSTTLKIKLVLRDKESWESKTFTGETELTCNTVYEANAFS